MHLILPPSETKISGGSTETLRLDGLVFPELTQLRVELIGAVEQLAADEPAMIRALKLGKTQHEEVVVNRSISSSPTMPVIDRFTGVLYDGLDVATLNAQQRSFAHRHVLVHSALLGPVRALDAVPRYRLSHDSRVPGISLRRFWSSSVAKAYSTLGGMVLDLRSEAYAGLGPVRPSAHARFLRVLSEDGDGTRRALNHFNKLAKGEFTRAVVMNGESFASIEELLAWASASGWRLEQPSARPNELDLIV